MYCQRSCFGVAASGCVLYGEGHLECACYGIRVLCIAGINVCTAIAKVPFEIRNGMDVGDNGIGEQCHGAAKAY